MAERARTRLVVNADDLGLHPAIDAGIFEAHERGLVTSATLLATGRSAPDAVARANASGLALGVHLCLSTGLPPAAPSGKVPTVAPGGRFRRSWLEFTRDWLSGRVVLDEIELELAAQLDRARALGARVDHLDAHQHLHLLPGICQRVQRLALREGLPLRRPMDWAFAPSRPGPTAKAWVLAALARAQPGWGPHLVGVGTGAAGALDDAALDAVLARLPPGDFELGCHPGRDPGRVEEDPTWRYGWDAERQALCSPTARAALARRGVTLTTYGALFGRAT